MIAMSFIGIRKSEKQLVRLELRNGKFMIWKESNQPSEGFDYVVGRLVGIDVRRCSTSKGELVYCDFQMVNDDDRFVISTLVSSGITANLVSRLKCVKDPANSMLRIDAWANNIYTNIYLKENGIPVTRVILPRVEKVEHDLKVEIDSTKRDAAVMAIIEEIKGKLHHSS